MVCDRQPPLVVQPITACETRVGESPGAADTVEANEMVDKIVMIPIRAMRLVLFFMSDVTLFF